MEENDNGLLFSPNRRGRYGKYDPLGGYDLKI